MKTLFIFLASFLIGSSVFSQAGTVTINVAGNRITQIAVDDQYYSVNNTSTTGQKSITLNSLSAGQHKLEIVRKNQTYNATTNSINTSFTVRDGYNLTVTINSNGAVSTSEVRIRRGGGSGNGNAISTAAYNKLYTQVKNKPSASSRTTLLETEFNTNRRYTSQQARSLIQLVNSESMRLRLAKLSYTSITDPANFSLVSSLLNSTANRNDLNSYIATIPVDDDNDSNGDANTPMNNSRFTTIYNEVMAEGSTAEKNYYLSNFFTKDFNFYTSAQARQLIQIVPTEAERFYLAKVAYRGVTDRQNYNLVSQLLSSSYNRTELATYISTYDNNNNNPGGTGTGVAMSTANFDQLYQSAYYQTSTSARYSSINTAFNTTGYYFTAAQAKKLIGLMTDEYSRLQLAKLSYKTLVDRYNYTQLNELLSTTASRNEFNTYVSNYNNYGSDNTGTGTAMSDANFNTIYNNVNGSWSTSTRVNLEADAFKSTTNYFTVYQVRRLLSLISSESDRLALAKLSYDNVTDKPSFSQLYDLFNSTANKNDLANFVANYTYGGGIPVYKTPVTESEFNSIRRDIQYTFGLGAKMSSLTKIFNDETKYYTVAQAKELIQLVSSESNRVELAKLSYNNLTDPTNFTQLYDIFSSQSSKDELNAWVTSNAYLNQ